MSHSQRYQIIGYIDTTNKFAGTHWSTHFKPQDCFHADHLPKFEEMKAYATGLGLWPSNKPGSSIDVCKPVYHVIGDGFDYLRCATCYPARANPDDFVERGAGA